MISLKVFRILQRNIKVWSKHYPEAIIGTTGEPILFLLVLGYGMGHYIKVIEGLSYIQYIAPGLWMTSAMHAASAECTYGAYTRMTTQKTYDAILATPINTYEIVAGEILFAVTRSFIDCLVILLVFGIFGLLGNPLTFLIPFVGLFIGLFFACTAMTLTALSHGYQSFIYFFTLVITPMFMLSGIFFPISNFPDWLQPIAHWLPLTQVVDVARGLFIGKLEWIYISKLVYVVLLSSVFFVFSAHLIRKRLIK